MVPGLTNLLGKLLLAHPNLRDANFRRTIIFLVKHDLLEGALGFIINRPTDQTFNNQDMAGLLPLNAQAKLYLGGPVAMDRIILAMLTWDAAAKRMTLDHSYEFESGAAVDGEVIAILGYSGWTAGQLEQELESESWIIAEPAYDLSNADASTWRHLVASFGAELKLLAEQPDDPSLN